MTKFPATQSAIQACINISTILAINPMHITEIVPEDGSGYNWLFRVSYNLTSNIQYFIDFRVGEVKEITKPDYKEQEKRYSADWDHSNFHTIR